MKESQKLISKGVIVLGGHIQSLGIIRIFGREGIPGIIIDNTCKNLARHSKYCKTFYLVKNDELLNFLLQPEITNLYNKWVIFPTNDYHVKLLSENKSQLEKNYIVATDHWGVIKLFYNKIAAYKLAKSLNIPIANTFYPASENELENIQIEYPCIIKPAVMHNFYRKVKKKVFVCKDLNSLKNYYRKAVQIIQTDEIIVQEIIKGPSKNQFSACFLFLNGISYISLTACRMRQHPLDFGNATTYAETIDIPILKELGKKILMAANFNGICEVEFKLDERDNQYKFLEINTRTWKWHSIANKADTPFLINYFNYLSGINIQPVEGFKKASFFHFLTDSPIQIKLLFKGYNYWNRKIRPIENAIWDKDDIKPWFFEKIYVFSFVLNR